ncbi:MAG: glycosyltransferase family 2 protein, partial [Candidatus Bathyarchaeota archaeon]
MESSVSVVVPVYNEASILRVNTERLREYLAECLGEHEIILCENGSVDDTAEIARVLADRFEGIEFLQLPEKSLGDALKAGIKAANYEKVVCFPIDLSIDMEFIPESVELLGIFDVVLGSKRLGLDQRSLTRKIPSMAYHGLVRRLFGVEFSDTTCVKAFRRECILGLLERVPS